MNKNPSKSSSTESVDPSRSFQVNESESGIEASESSMNDADIMEEDDTDQNQGLLQQAVRSAKRTAAASGATTSSSPPSTHDRPVEIGPIIVTTSNQDKTGYSGQFLGDPVDQRLEPPPAKVMAELPKEERDMAARGAVNAAGFERANEATKRYLRVATNFPDEERIQNEIPTPSSGYDGDTEGQGELQPLPLPHHPHPYHPRHQHLHHHHHHHHHHRQSPGHLHHDHRPPSPS
ncbi:hypothetical protein EC973_001006 [Apophysomyces ossiformis]|uniref:Uncharacterized protein n=1 Tax=Apophysomyces ossiformis TaxID=679940 RepID=A0A8H7EU07_9FUNG|nr:hypothetical protein EC973_001006 [Apophysomyces ossiformis]